LEPVILITPDELGALPYDLWQQGHPVRLALHTYFPNLAYPLSARLHPTTCSFDRSGPTKERLGERGTIEFLLQNVLGIQAGLLDHPPGSFSGWMNIIKNSPRCPAFT